MFISLTFSTTKKKLGMVSRLLLLNIKKKMLFENQVEHTILLISSALELERVRKKYSDQADLIFVF